MEHGSQSDEHKEDDRQSLLYNDNYEYNLDRVTYKKISIDDWNSIPTDHTPYSHCWSDLTSFDPATFSENSQKPSKEYFDSFWSILFFINLAITIIIFAVVFSKPLPTKQVESTGFKQKDSTNKQVTDSTNGLSVQLFSKSVRAGFIIALIANMLHMSYIFFFPSVYIHVGVVFIAINSVVMFIYSLYSGSVMMAIVSFLMATITIFFACNIGPNIKMTTAVLKNVINLLFKFPSIIMLGIIEVFLSGIVSVFYTYSVYKIFALEWSPWVYIYFFFSYTWISSTMAYIVYMTGAGLAATWYFLDGTEYCPKRPVWSSFKRATTTSFGSAALAAFILASIRALKEIIRFSTERSNNDGNEENNGAECVITVLRCMAMCILNVLEAYAQWISAYGLIYCAIFGVPYKEGCRRWMELECHKFIHVLTDQCILGNSLTYHGLFFSFISAGVAYMIGAPQVKIFYMAFALIFSYMVFFILEMPLATMSDTLFVCFAENPENMKSKNPELFDMFCSKYEANIEKLACKN